MREPLSAGIVIPISWHQRHSTDFAKWLRQNIRQTLIACPIFATVIALFVAAFEIADPVGARDRHWPGKCSACGSSASLLFRLAYWPSGCTSCRRSRQNATTTRITSAS